MSEDGRRPGGLTALAVLNFVFGGFAVIGVFGLFVLRTMIEEDTPEVRMYRDMSSSLFYTVVFLAALEGALLIASGVGYLKQKRFLGRILGSVYALVSLAHIALAFAMMPVTFNFASIIGLVYPVLTLILLNTTFKEDLVR